MPYDVDNSAGGALGFAASFLAGKQAKAKAQQDLQQQKTENAYKASMLALDQQYAADAHNKATIEGKTSNDQSFAHKELARWAAKHPAPNPSSPNYQASKAAWDQAYVYKARTLGIGQDAEAEISTGSLADLRGTQQEKITKGDIPLDQSRIGLNTSLSNLENTRSEQLTQHFAQQMAFLIAHGQQQQALQAQRIQAQSAALVLRIGAEYGLQNLRDQDRMAIGAMTAMLTLQGKGQQEAFQSSIAAYKAQNATYATELKADATATAAGNAVPFPDPQQPQAPQAPPPESYAQLVQDAVTAGRQYMGGGGKPPAVHHGKPSTTPADINTQREQLILTSIKGMNKYPPEQQKNIKLYIHTAVQKGWTADKIIGGLYSALHQYDTMNQPKTKQQGASPAEAINNAYGG